MSYYSVKKALKGSLILFGLVGCSDLLVGQEPVKGQQLDLPQPALEGTMTLEEAIYQRRSKRVYKDEVLTKKEISRICWAAQGMTDKNRRRRAAPSAGATYPLVVYLAMKNGVYRYHPEEHSLEKMDDGDRRVALAKTAWRQMWMAKASAIVVLTAVYDRTTNRYGNRGLQYVHLEAGHAAQNILLQATAMNMGTCPIGAFRPKAIENVLNIPEKEDVLYMITVGR